MANSASMDLTSAMHKVHGERDDGDYTLICGTKTIKAHSFILGNRSPFFKAALSVTMKEKEEMKMEVKDCLPEVLTETINYMYGIDISNNFGDYGGLLKIADRFLMEDLKREASLLLAKGVSKENYMEMSQLADKHNAKELVEKCSRYILYNVGNVNWDAIMEMPLVTISVLELSKQLVLIAKKDRSCGCKCNSGRGCGCCHYAKLVKEQMNK